MNTFKKFLVVLLSVMMIATISISCIAADGYNENDGTDATNPLTDTASFTFVKHYTLTGDTTNGSSPAENFTVTFTPYLVANIPAAAGITTANMPAIPAATLAAAVGAADTNAATDVTGTVTLPAYAAVGDYWYTVAETAGDTAGVTYDSSTYYLHVQVLHESDSSANLIRLVTLHTAAPNADGTPAASGDTKNDGIENDYANGSLSVTKDVTGNMGDRTKEYEVTVVFSYASTDSANCPVKSVISYTDGAAKTIAASGWTYDSTAAAWTVTATIGLSHEETVTFTNIPYGVTYEITETDYSADGYTHSFAFASADTGDSVTAESTGWSDAGATGSITDASDAVTVTNEKSTSIDVGVVLEDAPFIGTVVLTAAAVVYFVVSKRRKVTEK